VNFLDRLNDIALISFLRNSSEIDEIEAKTYDWETLIRQARHANLISRIAIFLEQSRIFKDIPNKPKQHFLNAIKISKAHERSARWEVQDIYQILSHHNIDFILLKGCAYIWQKNNASIGRLFGDTDILVKKDEIKKAERILVHSGWVTTKLDSYDQQYFRQWMHEIPPLHHTTRHTTLDVHHSIIPPITKTKLEIAYLWEDAIRDPLFSNIHTLSLIDMILHSATHLFHEGEFDNGLRDLVDLNELIHQYQSVSGNWEVLLNRAQQLDLSLFLLYALRYSNRILQTPLPNGLVSKLEQNISLLNINSWLIDKLYLRALTPGHASCKVPFRKSAILFLFIRSHWIKMPLPILIPHLFIKFRRQVIG
jgi:hypothetical protein